MKIKLVFLSLVQDITKTSEIIVELNDNVKLKDVIEFVFNKWPKLRELDKQDELLILLNGDLIRGKDLDINSSYLTTGGTVTALAYNGLINLFETSTLDL